MSCRSESNFPTTFARGVVTAIKFKDFPAPIGGTCNGKFIDDFILVSGCVVPAFSEVTYDVRIGAFLFRTANVVNNTSNPTTASILGSIAVTPDGKQIDFTDSGGTPRSFTITNGIWQDGFSVTVATQSIPPGSPPATVAINQQYIDLSMEPDSNFAGPNTPDIPQDLDGEPTPDPLDASKNNITISWDEPAGGPTPLIYFIERAHVTLGVVGSYVVRGFATNIAGTSQSFVDGYPQLTLGTTYAYRVRSARKLNLPDAGDAGISAYSNVFTFNYSTPNITIVGSGVFTFGGSAAVVTIVNPSGIYTLVINKTNDTLYERSGATTTQNVAIPTPYFVTGYAPPND